MTTGLLINPLSCMLVGDPRVGRATASGGPSAGGSNSSNRVTVWLAGEEARGAPS